MIVWQSSSDAERELRIEDRREFESSPVNVENNNKFYDWLFAHLEVEVAHSMQIFFSLLSVKWRMNSLFTLHSTLICLHLTYWIWLKLIFTFFRIYSRIQIKYLDTWKLSMEWDDKANATRHELSENCKKTFVSNLSWNELPPCDEGQLCMI